MSIRNVIVSYRQINEAFDKNRESILQAADDGIAKAVDTHDSLEAARMLAGLSGGLQALEAAEKIPGVLVTTDHPVASLLQTFLAKRASEEGKLEPIPSSTQLEGFKEAKFDKNDFKGWIGSFFTWWKGIIAHPPTGYATSEQRGGESPEKLAKTTGMCLASEKTSEKGRRGR